MVCYFIGTPHSEGITIIKNAYKNCYDCNIDNVSSLHTGCS